MFFRGIARVETKRRKNGQEAVREAARKVREELGMR